MLFCLSYLISVLSILGTVGVLAGCMQFWLHITSPVFCMCTHQLYTVTDYKLFELINISESEDFYFSIHLQSPPWPITKVGLFAPQSRQEPTLLRLWNSVPSRLGLQSGSGPWRADHGFVLVGLADRPQSLQVLVSEDLVWFVGPTGGIGKMGVRLVVECGVVL